MFTFRLRTICLAGLCFGVTLTACASDVSSNFPTGRFVRSDNKNHGLIFQKDGSFSVFDGGTTIVNGKYTIRGDTYTDVSNDQNCPIMTFKYKLDGSKLTFTYVGKPEADPCSGRRGDFNNQTYELALNENPQGERTGDSIPPPDVAEAMPAPGRIEERGVSERNVWLEHMLREDKQSAEKDARQIKAICAEFRNIVERSLCLGAR